MKFFTFRQLPVPEPSQFKSTRPNLRCPLPTWLTRRVERLNSWIVNPDERTSVRAELDAAMFHLYGINRDDVDYIMETFPIVKRKDVKEFGSYRSKEMILQVYDAMQEAIDSGVPYRSPFDSELEA